MSFIAMPRPRGEHTETKVIVPIAGKWRDPGGNITDIVVSAQGDVHTTSNPNCIAEKSASWRLTRFDFPKGTKINGLVLTLEGAGVSAQTLLGTDLSTLFKGKTKQTISFPIAEQTVGSLTFFVPNNTEFNWYKVAAICRSGVRK
jgi:hypothetical protein